MRRVYQTMREDSKGNRTGRYGGIRYSSVAKRGHSAVKKKAVKAPTRAKTKTTAKTSRAVRKVATAKKDRKSFELAKRFWLANGRDSVKKDDFTFLVSFQYRWMNPKEAKEALNKMIVDGAVAVQGDYIKKV